MSRGRRTNFQQQPIYTTIASFSATVNPTNKLYSLSPQSLCYICPPSLFPTAMPLSLLVHSPKFIQPLSGPHNSTHIIQQQLPISLKFPTTYQEMSHILPYSASHISFRFRTGTRLQNQILIQKCACGSCINVLRGLRFFYFKLFNSLNLSFMMHLLYHVHNNSNIKVCIYYCKLTKA